MSYTAVLEMKPGVGCVIFVRFDLQPNPRLSSKIQLTPKMQTHKETRSPGPLPVCPVLVGPAVDALEARLCELSPCRRRELRLTSQKDQSTEDVGVHMQLMP